MKRCPKCKTGKQEADFNRDSSRSDGLLIWCRKCAFKWASLLNRCVSCGETKSKAAFRKDTQAVNGLTKACRECLSTQVQMFRTFISPSVQASDLTPEQADYLGHLVKRKKGDAKRKGVKFDLTLQWMREQFLNGCALTGIPFDLTHSKNPFSLEVDRIAPGGDYSMLNSRFVCAIFNRVKWNYTDVDMFKMTLALVVNNWEQYQKYFRSRGLITDQDIRNKRIRQCQPHEKQ